MNHTQYNSASYKVESNIVERREHEARYLVDCDDRPAGPRGRGGVSRLQTGSNSALAAAPAPIVEGILADSDGVPIANTAVTAYADTPVDDPSGTVPLEAIGTTQTDGSGYFALTSANPPAMRAEEATNGGYLNIKLIASDGTTLWMDGSARRFINGEWLETTAAGVDVPVAPVEGIGSMAGRHDTATHPHARKRVDKAAAPPTPVQCGSNSMYHRPLGGRCSGAAAGHGRGVAQLGRCRPFPADLRSSPPTPTSATEQPSARAAGESEAPSILANRRPLRMVRTIPRITSPTGSRKTSSSRTTCTRTRVAASGTKNTSSTGFPARALGPTPRSMTGTAPKHSTGALFGQAVTSSATTTTT